MPKVSIIIPVYNVEPYLRQCLDSVLAQTFVDFEAILVDDGSTDGSEKICDEYAAKDARFKVIHQENAGPSEARNAGIENARGSYLYFADSDDWLGSDTVEKLYEGIVGSGSQYVVCGYYKETEHIESFSPPAVSYENDRLSNMLRYARKEFSYAVWNKMYRRNVIIENNIFFYEGEKCGEDQAFNLKYLFFCDKAAVIQEPLYHYRIREGQITAESPEKRLPTYIEDTKKLINDFKSYGKYDELRDVLAVHFAARFNEYLGGLAKNKSLSKKRKILLVNEIKRLYEETGFSRNLKHTSFTKKERLFLTLLVHGNAGILLGGYRLYAFLQRMSAVMWRIVEKMKKAPQYAKVRIENCFYTLKYPFVKDSIFVNTESIEATIGKIIDDKVSVSRFGDGEFRWIENLKHNSFQDVDEKLSERLLEVLKSKSDSHIVCITPAFSGLEFESQLSKKYWKTTLGQYGMRWAKHLDRNRVYSNANISRFYLNDISKALVRDRFSLLKKIWDDRDLLIVEGEMSRMGVGNDLFDNAQSIRRLIAPKHNAFYKYDEILKKAKLYGNGKLILIALGPTATLLAYDLAMSGYQAVDIGHVDIEYEWFLMGATRKVPVRWREVNEAKTNIEIPFDGLERKIYDSQIIDTVLP